MMPGAVRILKRIAVLAGVALVTVLGVRAYDSQRGAPLEPWHTYVPEELHADALAKADWAGYLAAENAIFDKVRTEVTDKLPPEDRTPANRYFASSPVYPPHFAQDWNRSYTLMPAGKPVGAVVLLHGLTDSPYSLRHIARHYQQRGWVAVAIRLPGHGTVPAGLTDVEWPDWVAATRLAVREAQRLAGTAVPLQLVGFSNGGTLALKYALDAIEDPRLARPQRLVLLSPMVGVTSMARFAGVLGWPAVFPAFAKAAWLDLVPEFNPFKYNSFPVNGARQSSLFSRALQEQVVRLARTGQLERLPPVLTFQSVLDFTVSTRAVVNALYDYLPANGSELVLFDLNHNAHLGPLMRPANGELVARLLPAPPRRYAATVITNAGTHALDVVGLATPAGSVAAQTVPLGLRYPPDVYSLSHVALPFPPDDGLYGAQPDARDDFGVQLGAMAARGERAALIVSLDALIRMSSNPFFPYLLQRMDEGIAERAGPSNAQP